jgi:hypothetical protein
MRNTIKLTTAVAAGVTLFGCLGQIPDTPLSEVKAQTATKGLAEDKASLSVPVSSGTARSGNRAPDFDGAKLFTKGGWWQELARPIENDPVHPNSDTLMSRFKSGKLRIDFSTTTARGGNSIYGMPFNIVPESQPDLPLKITRYRSPEDPKAVPFFREMSIEKWQPSDGTPPTPGQISGDHHALVFRRGATPGTLKELFEGNYVTSRDGGETWETVGLARWDLTTGAPRQDGYSSGDAGGLPIAPLLIRYDEVQRGRIDHTLRINVPAGTFVNKYVWPARSTAYTGIGGDVQVVTDAPAAAGATSLSVRPLRKWSSNGLFIPGTVLSFTGSGTKAVVSADVGGEATTIPVQPLPAPVRSGDCATVAVAIPMGARLRLKSSWLAANRDAAPPNIRVIFDALRKYGGIVADLTTGGLYINGINDERWTMRELHALMAVPCSAFEIVEPPAKLEFTGPNRGQVGAPLTFKVRHTIPADSRFSTNVYFFQSSDGGATWSSGKLNPSVFRCDDTHRGPFTVTFTPPAEGTYLIKADPYQDWLDPPLLSVSVVGTAPAKSEARRKPATRRPGSTTPGPTTPTPIPRRRSTR